MVELITLKPDEMQGQRPTFQPVQGTWIAGGAIRQWFSPEKVSDIDIFGTSKGILDNFVTDKLAGFKLAFSNKITDTYRNQADTIVQIIHGKTYNTVNDLLDSFDFTICQFAWDGTNIYTTKNAVISTLRKHLAVHKITKEYAVDSLRRAFKYSNKGFKPCWGTLRDLANAMREPTIEQIKANIEISPNGGMRGIRFD